MSESAPFVAEHPVPTLKGEVRVTGEFLVDLLFRASVRIRRENLACNIRQNVPDVCDLYSGGIFCLTVESPDPTMVLKVARGHGLEELDLILATVPHGADPQWGAVALGLDGHEELLVLPVVVLDIDALYVGKQVRPFLNAQDRLVYLVDRGWNDGRLHASVREGR
jgi:hypothetical protein